MHGVVLCCVRFVHIFVMLKEKAKSGGWLLVLMRRMVSPNYL